jgi:hypothetical protein
LPLLLLLLCIQRLGGPAVEKVRKTFGLGRDRMLPLLLLLLGGLGGKGLAHVGEIREGIGLALLALRLAL